MADSVNPQVVDAVTGENFKVGAGGPAFYLNMAMSDAVSHQRSVNLVREAILARATKQIVGEDPQTAVSDQKVLSGNDLASTITQLLAALASNQQSAKVAQSTPPETAVPKA